MKNKAKRKNPVVVLVCGGSGSGKTTIAELIKSNIPKGYSTQIISLDDFYFTPEQKVITNYDSPDAIDWFGVAGVINTLVNYRIPVKMCKYDFANKVKSAPFEIPPSDVIIIEGIFSLYKEEIRTLSNLSVFVEVPDDERLIRRILRDQKARGTNVEETIKMWRDTVIDMHHKYVEPQKYHADLIIPWHHKTDTTMSSIKAISGAIEYAAYSTNNKSSDKITKEIKAINRKHKEEDIAKDKKKAEVASLSTSNILKPKK